MLVMSVSYLFPPEDLSFRAFAFIANIGPTGVKSPQVCDTLPVSAYASKPKRNTKIVGDLSELLVAAALTRLGYTVSKPIGDSYRYDLVADDGDTLYRVQVKTGRLWRGSVRVNCFSSHLHRNGGTRSYRGEIDYTGVFCPQTGHVYMVPESDIVDSAMHLRVAPTVNRQDKRIRWATKYQLT